MSRGGVFSRPPLFNHMNTLKEHKLVKEMVQEQFDSVINEGFFDQIQKAIDYTGQLATLQATQGGGAVKDELVDKLTDFVEKAKGKTKSPFAKNLIQDLENKIQQVHSQKGKQRKKRTDFTRQRDERGRFLKRQQQQQQQQSLKKQ